MSPVVPTKCMPSWEETWTGQRETPGQNPRAEKSLFPYPEDLLKMLRTDHLTKISSYMFLHVNRRKRNSNPDMMMRTCNPPNILGMEEAHRSEIPSLS